ncbi:MAG: hypothetical protein ACLUCE_09575 [Streptococcus sp.]|uniref:hypothetical protein n=1 Tax=Streptococcus sp. TaxID=1306 RepID=UPI003996B1B7
MGNEKDHDFFRFVELDVIATIVAYLLESKTKRSGINNEIPFSSHLPIKRGKESGKVNSFR